MIIGQSKVYIVSMAGLNLFLSGKVANAQGVTVPTFMGYNETYSNNKNTDLIPPGGGNEVIYAECYKSGAYGAPTFKWQGYAPIYSPGDDRLAQWNNQLPSNSITGQNAAPDWQCPDGYSIDNWKIYGMIPQDDASNKQTMVNAGTMRKPGGSETKGSYKIPNPYNLNMNDPCWTQDLDGNPWTEKNPLNCGQKKQTGGWGSGGLGRRFRE